MTPTTKNPKASPTMRGALDMLFRNDLTSGAVAAGIDSAALLGTWRTRDALVSRGFVRRQGHGAKNFKALYQITEAGCEAIGRTMDEIVAWAYDEAGSEYYERAMRGEYTANRMTTMPQADTRLPLDEAWADAVSETAQHRWAYIGGLDIMTEVPTQQQVDAWKRADNTALGLDLLGYDGPDDDPFHREPEPTPPTFRELLDATIAACVLAELAQSSRDYRKSGMKADAKTKLAELYRRLDAFEADDPFWTTDERGVAASLREILNGRDRGTR